MTEETKAPELEVLDDEIVMKAVKEVDEEEKTFDVFDDLSLLETKPKAEEGAWMTLKNPANGRDIHTKNGPARILLLGKDSAKFRRRSRETQNRRLKNMKPGQSVTVRVEDIEADSMSLVVLSTKAWENIVIDGEELECTQENAIIFYSKFPAFFEQADSWIGNRANFMKAPKSN